jgi:hypothetical protein
MTETPDFAMMEAHAKSVEHYRCVLFALNALWGSVENDKRWLKKNEYIAVLVQRVLTEITNELTP